MTRPRYLGWASVAVLATCMGMGCKGDGDQAASESDLIARCDQLAQACGDADKHVQTIGQECKNLAEEAGECAAEALALYDCYERQLCPRDDDVWAFDDLRVLSDRHHKCLEERDALNVCLENREARE
jgi:hypothetical protein